MSEIIKSEVTTEDLRLINTYSKAELKSEDVYTFKVACCDNQIDRDFERFSDKALSQLAKLYVGKTIIKNHDPKTDNQCARIYKTDIESDGNGGKRLIAYAYTPINENTKDFISDIETGIKKEVSVGCQLSKRPICSICGKDFYDCQHLKSKEYDGEICCAILDDISDVYELSFVAIPAQRNAGVIKSFKPIPQPKKADNALQVRLRLAKADEDILNFESEEFTNESK